VAFPAVTSQRQGWHGRLRQGLHWFASSMLPITGGRTGHAGSEDEAALHFDAFFREQEPRIFGYLWRLTGDRHLASDLCQETFLRAWHSFAKVRGYENQAAWLLRVATNLALNSRRRRNTRIGVPLALEETQEPSQSDHAGRVAEQDAVHQALLALPVRMRAALVLREVEGLPYAEVSRLLEMNPGATRMLLSRAREQFRRCYRHEEEGQ
jgi:RNA polymerase sigma-70 factor, ECF subfamily